MEYRSTIAAVHADPKLPRLPARGTGSNIYNANLARTLAGLGHEVDLFCQDRTVHEPEGVTIHVPDIGRVLPVYVADRYEGCQFNVTLAGKRIELRITVRKTE